MTLITHYLKNSIIYSVNSKNIIWKTLNPVTNTKQFLIVFHFLLSVSSLSTLSYITFKIATFEILIPTYAKRDDFNFPIVNFPFICSNIPAGHVYGVYISQLIFQRGDQVWMRQWSDCVYNKQNISVVICETDTL